MSSQQALSCTMDLAEGTNNATIYTLERLPNTTAIRIPQTYFIS